MPAPNVLVVAVDGLRASAMGAYGNTSWQTPALDRFATESYLFDWCYAPSPELTDIYGALWESRHPARKSSATMAETGARLPITLPQVFAGHGYETTLVTDEPELMALAVTGDFHHKVTVDETHATSAVQQLFTLAGEFVRQPLKSSIAKPRLLWLHSRGNYGPWDAPLELQQSLLDEGDPPPIEPASPPDFFIEPTSDPDVAFRYACAYAAQIMALDAEWEQLLEAVKSSAGDEWLVVLIGVRGYPLGEHRRVGGIDTRLYAEQLHVPLLTRFPDDWGRLSRRSELTTHLDLLPTLLDSIGELDAASGNQFDGLNLRQLSTKSRPASWRDALIATSTAGDRSIRTVTWSYREARVSDDMRDASSHRGELFVRPDDRWEANDVAKLCPEVVDELSAAASNAVRQLKEGVAVPHDILPSVSVAHR
jgi:arylsulfatase A-like enzyme